MKIRYYQTPGGRSPIEDFLLGLPAGTRLEIADTLLLLESGTALAMPRRELDIIKKRLKEI